MHQRLGNFPNLVPRDFTLGVLVHTVNTTQFSKRVLDFGCKFLDGTEQQRSLRRFGLRMLLILLHVHFFGGPVGGA